MQIFFIYGKYNNQMYFRKKNITDTEDKLRKQTNFFSQT